MKIVLSIIKQKEFWYDWFEEPGISCVLFIIAGILMIVGLFVSFWMVTTMLWLMLVAILLWIDEVDLSPKQPE